MIFPAFFALASLKFFSRLSPLLGTRQTRGLLNFSLGIVKFGILRLALPNGAINRFPSFLSLSSDPVKSSTSLNRRSFLRLAGGAVALPTILPSRVFGQN